MRGQTITDTRTLVTETCSNCGILFAMEADFRERLVNDPNRTFYCPSGHPQHYVGKTWEQKLKEKEDALAWDRRQIANLRDDLNVERASHSATKGHLTRAKKQVERVEKGVCPHCRRHFVNVERHMKSKHEHGEDA